MIDICGKDEVSSKTGFTHFVSFSDPGTEYPLYLLGKENAFKEQFLDLIKPDPSGPTEAMMCRLLEYFNKTDVDSNILFQCNFGLSRSTAAAAVFLSIKHPELSEIEIADRVSDVRHKTWPNSLMLHFADKLTGHENKHQRIGILMRVNTFKFDPDWTNARSRTDRSEELQEIKHLMNLK